MQLTKGQTLISTSNINQTIITGLPTFFEFYGPDFFAEDLYEIAGSFDYVVTFVFKHGSDSYIKFGEMVTGSIFYPKGEREQIEEHIRDRKEYTNQIIKLEVICFSDINKEVADKLKYEGFPCTDLSSLSFVKFSSFSPYKSSVIKKIPNIIKIPVSSEYLTKINFDIISNNLIVSKVKSGTILIDEERAEYVGNYLARHNNEIDLELLKMFGYDEKSANNDKTITYHYLVSKERRNCISESEKQYLSNLKNEIYMNNLNLLANELTSGFKTGEPIISPKNKMEFILKALKIFRPKVLYPIKRQIWWDLQSYLHIVFRHVKDFQFGKYQDKTPFPYELVELESLIIIIIESILDEIKNHFSNPSQEKTFYRTGKMCVYYNGDYYSIRICPNGRLETIYVTTTEISYKENHLDRNTQEFRQI